jgi:hypothetical protein
MERIVSMMLLLLVVPHINGAGDDNELVVPETAANKPGNSI